MGNIDEISKAIGSIEVGIKNLNEKFDSLPCKFHATKIGEHEKWKNEASGMVVVIGLIFGFIGWFLTPVLNWLLDKIK